MFRSRSKKLERIDTGDYTPDEYDRFLEEIRFVNKYTGDRRAILRALKNVAGKVESHRISVLDVGAGSGELLRAIARSSFLSGVKLNLVGLDSNTRSADSILEESSEFKEISSVQGDALRLPFEDSSFDYVICSLFTHHLTNEEILDSFREMARVSMGSVIVIDLHRHPLAYLSYKAMCLAVGISELVTHDGSLSILRGFKPKELLQLGHSAGLTNVCVNRSFPFRLVLKSGRANGTPIRQ